MEYSLAIFKKETKLVIIIWPPFLIPTIYLRIFKKLMFTQNPVQIFNSFIYSTPNRKNTRCLSISEQSYKLWYIHTMEHTLQRTRYKLTICAVTCMTLQRITPSEKSQSNSYVFVLFHMCAVYMFRCMSHMYKILYMARSWKQKADFCFPVVRKVVGMGWKCSYLKWTKMPFFKNGEQEGETGLV
jgi:hypothetical protein